MKDNKILFGTLIVLLLLLTVGLSYAYFSTSVKGNDNAKDVIVEAGTLKLTYTDGPAINAQYIKPGWSTTKEVSVKNNGTLDAYYNVIWQSLTNTITNNELVLSATCQRLNSAGTVEGTCESISQALISDMTIAKKISIESGFTHKYTFTILFKETNADQNYNQGKEFNGVLGIEEYKKPDFATDSWSTIIANVKAGHGSEYKVGSTKEVNLGSTYGTHTLRIANTSTPSECSTTGFSQTACGFVLEFADIITTHKMNDTNTNVGGWPATSMRTFVNNDIYNALPSEIRNAIIDTTVVSGHGSTSGETNFTSTDKLYLLSTAEVWSQGSSNTIKYDTARDVTRQLDYYKNLGTSTSNYSGAIKKNGTSGSYWWLRAATSANTDCFLGVSNNGDWNINNAYDAIGVAPAFRLG
ncbi:MAG: CalY family protein [Clostridium sp.]|nr:MAG: CalY family protein [Clostridium sp.]